jgi:hypothetical protein
MEAAGDLQAACRELLPGYAHVRREPERWALLTPGCLGRRPVERSGEPGPPAAERFGLVPSFRPASLGHAEYTLATLYADAAYKRHLAARGNAQRVALQAAETGVHERLARQARSWGVELSV